MARIMALVAAALMCTWPSPATSLDMAPECEEGLAPLHSEAPRLPRHLHNEYSGEVVTLFTVLADGTVHNPIVFTTRWQRVGKARAEPKGYEDAVIEALGNWRYPTQQEACLHGATIAVHWHG